MLRRNQIQCEVEGHGARFMRVANVFIQNLFTGGMTVTTTLYDYKCVKCEAIKAAQAERDDANADLI